MLSVILADLGSQLSFSGVAREVRGCGGAGRTERHLLGAANGRKLKKIHVQILIVTVPCLPTIKTKRYAYSELVAIAITLRLWLSVTVCLDFLTQWLDSHCVDY